MKWKHGFQSIQKIGLGIKMHKSEVEILRIVHGVRIASYGSVKKALDKLLREKLKKHISKYFLEEKNEGSSIVILKKQEHKKNIPKKLR